MMKTKGYIISAIAFTLIIAACKKEDGTQKGFEPQELPTTYINGSLNYYSELEEANIIGFSNAAVELMSETAQSFDTWVKQSATKADFLLGPLTDGCYQVESSYTDTVTHISYMSSNTVIMSGTEVEIDINLNPVYNYTVKYKVVDEEGNPKPNTTVYLYDNYGYLADYPGNAAVAIAVQTTNSKGNVIFHNLLPNTYYAYAELSIPQGDSTLVLDSYDPDFEPATVEPLSETTLTIKPNLVIK